MSNEVKIGHLGKADAAKINNVPVVEGQVIFSEGHFAQFADFAGKRHVYGDIISGVYNDKYIDFNGDITWDEILNAIIVNGNVNDGQKLKILNNIMTYRKIGQNNFISVEGINPGAVPFIINYGNANSIAHQIGLRNKCFIWHKIIWPELISYFRYIKYSATIFYHQTLTIRSTSVHTKCNSEFIANLQ